MQRHQGVPSAQRAALPAVPTPPSGGALTPAARPASGVQLRPYDERILRSRALEISARRLRTDVRLCRRPVRRPEAGRGGFGVDSSSSPATCTPAALARAHKVPLSLPQRTPKMRVRLLEWAKRAQGHSYPYHVDELRAPLMPDSARSVEDSLQHMAHPAAGACGLREGGVGEGFGPPDRTGARRPSAGVRCVARHGRDAQFGAPFQAGHVKGFRAAGVRRDHRRRADEAADPCEAGRDQVE